MKSLELELIEAKNEIQYWKYVASHLASCHAATLEGLPKSASKSTRQRHVNICSSAAEYLKGTKNVDTYSRPFSSLIEWNIKRCEESAVKYAQIPS